MTIDGALVHPPLLWTLAAIYAAALYGAWRLAPWRKLRDSEQLHVFLGSSVALLFLWHLSPQVQPGVNYHLLGVTAVTLMLGWSLAVIATSLALLGATLDGSGDFSGFALNALLSGVLPVTVTQVLLVLIRWYLPKQFFVYVLVNGFLTAGLAGAASAWAAIGLLVASGTYTYAELGQTLVPFIPLMLMPEAFLNGALMTVLVAFKPRWVYSFSDEQYLRGK